LQISCLIIKVITIEQQHICDTTEFWSYVGNKSNQRWTWYCIERSTGIILACHNDSCSDADFLEFYNLLSNFSIKRYYIDSWGSYSRYIHADKHIIDKAILGR